MMSKGNGDWEGGRNRSMLFTIRTLHSLFQNSKKNMLSKFIKDSFFICLKKVFCIYFPTSG